MPRLLSCYADGDEITSSRQPISGTGRCCCFAHKSKSVSRHVLRPHTPKSLSDTPTERLRVQGIFAHARHTSRKARGVWNSGRQAKDLPLSVDKSGARAKKTDEPSKWNCAPTSETSCAKQKRRRTKLSTRGARHHLRQRFASAAQSSLNRRQLGHTQHQPLDPMPTKVDLHPRVRPIAF